MGPLMENSFLWPLEGFVRDFENGFGQGMAFIVFQDISLFCFHVKVFVCK